MAARSRGWFPQDALKPGVAPREAWAWAMYDFANSGFTTVVITAVFNAYFVGVIAEGQPWATLAWTLALGASNALVMMTIPLIGAHADARGLKKRWLAVSTVGCITGTLLLALCGPGDLWWAILAVAWANLCFSWGESLIAAFLPEIAQPQAMGRVSGWGWSLGYLGGMLALGLSLGYVLWAQSRGLTAEQFVPVTMVITAVVYAAAALFTFAGLRERSHAFPDAAQALTLHASCGLAAARLRRTAREVITAREHRGFLWLLACGSAYQAGISVVIALAAVYAEQAMGFGQTDTMMLIFLVNIAAAMGAFAFGYFQDRIGHKPALAITLFGWIGMTVLAVLAQAPGLFWAAAVLAGLCMGSSQSAGRALAGLLAPADRAAEFFGLWSFAVRLAAIVGPITYGLITWATEGNHRAAILSTGLFFVLGLLLLRPISLQRVSSDAAR